MRPATLEGCVVRLTDTIAYIGQDIDDAIRIGLIKREALPIEATRVLGNTNGQIIETLVNDVVRSSYNKNYISFSAKIYQSLYLLKKYNYQAIYKSPKLKINHERIERGFEFLFHHFLQALKEDDKDSTIFKHFVNSKSVKYLKNTTREIIVRDFLASMTDRYFTQALERLIVPQMADIKY